MRAEWRPPGDVPEPLAPPELPDATPEQPGVESPEVPEPPAEPREKPPPGFVMRRASQRLRGEGRSN